LKIFFTQFGLTLPLTLDPPVIFFMKWIRCKDYKVPKNRNLESVYAKKGYFFSPSPAIHACGIRWAHPSRPRSVKNSPSPLSRPPQRGDHLCSNASASSRGGGSPDWSRDPAACARPRPPRSAAVTPPDAPTVRQVAVRPATVPHHDVLRR
jgi:hypothetical protein